MDAAPAKIILFANTEWYLYNFRRSLALALREAGHEVLLISPPGRYGAKLRALGLRWEPVPMNRRSLNPVRELLLLDHLRRLFRSEKPALVHSFTVKCAVYGSIAARMAGVPARVNAVAGLGYVFTSASLKARFLRPIVRLLMRCSLGGRGARLILQNPDDVDLFEHSRLVDATQIRLIAGSGVDCTRFALKRGRRQVGQPIKVLLAARLLWDKGVAEYVAAARRLRQRGADARFLLAGTPDLDNPAAVPVRLVEGWVAEGSIEWLGHVDDMAALLSSVDIFALPSYYREGLPRSLIEAAASSLPLVTVDSPGCRDVVTDGENGLLIPPRDAEALANAIMRLIDDAVLASRLGVAARDKALREFDERVVIRRTLDVYREIVGRASKSKVGERSSNELG
ncbi:MAG: glycosyltransferase family 4 protein [Gammaproteobacteria bacterium]